MSDPAIRLNVALNVLKPDLVADSELILVENWAEALGGRGAP